MRERLQSVSNPVDAMSSESGRALTPAVLTAMRSGLASCCARYSRPWDGKWGCDDGSPPADAEPAPPGGCVHGLTWLRSCPRDVSHHTARTRGRAIGRVQS